jgi:hypothetical protein
VKGVVGRFIRWAKQVDWQHEPIAVTDIIRAVVAALAGAGLTVSDHMIAAVVAYVTAFCLIASFVFPRRAVDSSATAAAKQRHAEQLLSTAASALSAAPAITDRARLCPGPPLALSLTTATFPPANRTDISVPFEPPVIPNVEDLYDVTEPAPNPAGDHPQYKLGRVVDHDPRNRQYALPEPEATVAYKAVRWTRRAPVLDQGQVGSCTGNAAAGWLGTDNAARQGLTELAGHERVDELLALSIYSAAEVIDGDGPYPPNDNGSSGPSVAKVLKARGLSGDYLHAFTPAAADAALHRGPGMAGTNWYQSMFKPAAGGTLTVNKSSGLAGGHEYVIDEVEVDAAGNVTAVWMTNSWGESWGINGRARILRKDFEALLADDGDFTVPSAVNVPTPTPPPAPGADASFLAALDGAHPGLAAWLAAKAAAKHESAVAYAAGLLAGIGHVK